MSQNDINYFYDYLGLDTSNFKIFYDFSATTGALLPSIPNGSPLYSGRVVGSTGTFISNGSGIFSGSTYLKIQNIDRASFSGDSTFLFVYEKPTSGAGILFSSLTGSAFKSGYNIGINDANRLYFEYYDNEGPVIVTSNIIYGQKNAVAVGVSLNNVSFNYYNFNSAKLESEDFFIDSSYLLFSDQWHLGRNIAQHLPVNQLTGNIDLFANFNTAISYGNITRLFSGLYASPVSFPATSGTLVTTGVIGYENIFTGTPGVTGYDVVYNGFSGSNPEYNVLLTGGYGDPIILSNISSLKFWSGGNIYPYTGDISTFTGYYYTEATGTTGNLTGDYNPFYFAELQNKLMFSGGNFYPVDSIGGFYLILGSDLDYIPSGFLNCSSCPSYTVTELTGFLESGYISTPIYGTQTGYYRISDGYTGYDINTGYLNTFGMDYVSYISQPLRGSSEIYVLTGSFGINYLNKKANFDNVKSEFSIDDFYQSGNLNVFLNGLLQIESGYIESGEYYETSKTKIADFYIEDQYIISDNEYVSSDIIYYDFNQQQNRGILNYTGSATISYPYSDKQVWLNGQKLISGDDFTYSASTYTFSTGVRQITGKLAFVNNYTGANRVTGNYNRYVGPKYVRDTAMYYLNGIRISEDSVIEHAKIDMISGSGIFDTSSSVINNNSSDFWEN